MMLWRDLQRIRGEVPLVLNITNFVVMNTTANALLALGAAPVMAHAVEEVEDMTGLARALVINLGTLSAHWIEAMFLAGKAARQGNIPIVLDIVGCGATAYRTKTAQDLIREIRPTILRGNASEIRALAHAEICNLGDTRSGTRGVDSQHTPDEVLTEARALSLSAGCVVSVSGPIDLIVEGERVARIANGHPLMSRVTGMGCTASALTGAFAAVNAQPFDAASHAMGVMGVAGELAAEGATGPGSFQVRFLDALHQLKEVDLTRRLRESMA